MNIKYVSEAILSLKASVSFGKVVNCMELSEAIIQKVLETHRFTIKDDQSHSNFDELHDTLAQIIENFSDVDFSKVWNTKVVSEKIEKYLVGNYNIREA